MTSTQPSNQLDMEKIAQPVRRYTFNWFSAMATLLICAGILAFFSLYRSVSLTSQAAEQAAIETVKNHIAMVDDNYAKLTLAALNVLRQHSLQHGEPYLLGTVQLGNETLPALWFGKTAITANEQIVDHVSALMGGTATLFVRHGNDFIRIATNVKKADGTRAIGTKLDPTGKALAALHQGHAFTGVVEILDKPYFTTYQPIKTHKGELIGVWYTGYPIEMLEALRGQIQKIQILKRGFVSLVSPNGNILFQSKDVAPNVIDAMLAKTDRDKKLSAFEQADYQVHHTHVKSWDFSIISAIYKPDLINETLRFAWQVLSVILASALLGLAMSMRFARYLTTTLVQANAARELAETHEMQANEAKEQAQAANAAKSSFLANMSHELRTPLNAIIGYSEMLQEEAIDCDQEAFIPDLQKIHGSGKHLLALINDILDLSKIESGKMELYLESFDINEMLADIKNIIYPLMEKNHNQFLIDAPSFDKKMHADITKVRQVLFNLLSNASKFTNKGTIQLTVSQSSRNGIDFIVFSVKDSGIGMTEEQISRLFQPFTQADASTTRKYGGTGLGLTISKYFCTMMGGDISINSVINEGSEFIIQLPFIVQHALLEMNSLTDYQPSEMIAGAATILVIDDDPMTQNMLSRFLNKEGFNVAIAANGKTGIELAMQLQPKAITLDVNMPTMDGWAVLKQLKDNPQVRDIPVIMLTLLDNKNMGYALGAADYLNKPVDKQKLLITLNKYCRNMQNPILIIDDDALSRDSLASILRQENFTVIEAENGRVALEYMQTLQPELIFLDLLMPEMDGFEFIEALKKQPHWHKTRIIVITAKDITAQDRQRLNGWVENILQKRNTDNEVLLNDIRHFLAWIEVA